MRLRTLVVGLLLVGVTAAPARTIAPWPYDKLLAEADVLVIATSGPSVDVKEPPDNPWRQSAVGVHTTLEVRATLKGKLPTGKIELVHYRLRNGSVPPNGPTLVVFRPETEYLLFLKRRADGRYEPAGGMTDPAISVTQLNVEAKLPVVPAAASRSPATDYQEVADRWEWQWSPDCADLITAVACYRGPYQVEVVKPKGEKFKFTIRLTDDGREVFSWAGHPHSTFSQDRNVLYYADYWPDRTGCEIVARDLKAGKELWRTNLRGLGPIKHLGYSNRVALGADHPLITVRGKESLGRYLEFLDPRTGGILGHRIYEGPYRRKRDGEWVNLPTEKWNDPSPFR